MLARAYRSVSGSYAHQPFGLLPECYPKGAITIGETAALDAPVRLHVGSTALSTYLDALAAPLGQPRERVAG